MPPLGKSTVNISVYTPKGPPVLPWPSGQHVTMCMSASSRASSTQQPVGWNEQALWVNSFCCRNVPWGRLQKSHRMGPLEAWVASGPDQRDEQNQQDKVTWRTHRLRGRRQRHTIGFQKQGKEATDGRKSATTRFKKISQSRRT